MATVDVTSSAEAHAPGPPVQAVATAPWRVGQVPTLVESGGGGGCCLDLGREILVMVVESVS